MSTLIKKVAKPRRTKDGAKNRRATPASTAKPAGPGDLARATFARWDREHKDSKPMSWEKLQAVLEKNRLREAPLFSE
jgi:hypothetical protein